MKGYPLQCYPARCPQAAAIMMMIMNNLDPAVAQFPHELVTYGGNGSVFSNWAQFHLTMHYLSQMTMEQTLAMYSGHPLGLFPSHADAPRVVVTNGMTVFNYSSRADYERMYALGVSQFGQMTAGSYCYIGPQGIVHGTTLTLLNASRKYLKSAVRAPVFVTSGLGGMSGAQPKAGVIAGCVTVVAEVCEAAARKRFSQGWVNEILTDVDEVITRIRQCRERGHSHSIAYLGNIVSLWERLADEPQNLVDLGSDQTSLHNPYMGGYFPVQISYEEANVMMTADPVQFKALVQESLRRQVNAINRLAARGMAFWDYGNSFLLEASRAGAEILKPDGQTFRYPSYVEDIMGDVFSLGFGPFRWVCTSNELSDLRCTDRIAGEICERLAAACPSDNALKRQQYEDNQTWIRAAESHNLVVGAAARILYSDAEGRRLIAAALNEAIANGTLKGPVILSRDHHDVSGTDSPFRETCSVADGSRFCADMAVQNFAGLSCRGATWISLHNGGGTGWGEAVNGGFGLLLDGSPDAARRADSMLRWDVTNGVARRAWSRNPHAERTIVDCMQQDPLLKVTMPEHVDDEVLESL
eukprot:gnl/Spiro4/4503_TR2234_c0_g1_i4.p1 gnl/Spiro4/4503_TR2234_c0_g1~~gnl/Spiro4/4503_TR2234_c0_g1_i4.p1  ORF type:complete len:584 (+),score=59.85 gnl/Spiro4/4503_TR2234_c0_g1_i4:393-2144(+)